MRRISTYAPVICLILLGTTALADDITSFAFRGSAERCKSYMILEGGFMTRISQSGISDEATFLIPMDIGYMSNLSQKCAIGGSLHFAGGGDFTRIALRPRLKLWTGKRSGWDISLAPTFSSGAGYGGGIKSPGFCAGLSYSMGELLSLDIYYESYRLTFGGHHTGMYVGATGRSYLALVAPVIIVIGIAVSGGINIGTTNY